MLGALLFAAALNGKALFEARCASCHALAPQKDPIALAAAPAPSLAYAGSKFRHEWLAAWLAAPPQALPSYVPQRVFDSRQRTFGDFESMLADLARADVVFVGEQHDDPNTHRLELAIVEGLLRRRAPIVIGMEMFERDVQPVLDQYLAGTIPEEQFLKESRPWPRYATDYRAIVELARRGVTVDASPERR